MEKLRERIKDANMRMTKQRQAILEYVYSAKTHPTADEIYQAIHPKFERLSLATVYNNLKALVKLGYIVEMTYGDNATRFDYSEDEHHYHAICTQCQHVFDFQFDPLDTLPDMVRDRLGFQAVSQRLEIFGICHNCQKNNRESKMSHDE